MVAYGSTRVNARTKAMLTELERLCGFPITVTQGYNPGGVAASGGTHDGQGVADLRVATLTKEQRKQLIYNGRMIGFAIWLRDPAQGNWPWHAHAVAIREPNLSNQAKNQVTDYRQNRNGLANDAPDDGPRQFINVVWETYLVAQQREDVFMSVTPEQLKTIFTDALAVQRQADDRYEAQAEAWRAGAKVLANQLEKEGKTPDEVKNAVFQYLRPLWVREQ